MSRYTIFGDEIPVNQSLLHDQLRDVPRRFNCYGEYAKFNFSEPLASQFQMSMEEIENHWIPLLESSTSIS